MSSKYVVNKVLESVKSSKSVSKPLQSKREVFSKGNGAELLTVEKMRLKLGEKRAKAGGRGKKKQGTGSRPGKVDVADNDKENENPQYAANDVNPGDSTLGKLFDDLPIAKWPLKRRRRKMGANHAQQFENQSTAAMALVELSQGQEMERSRGNGVPN
ncbi:hypothetical protein FGB62_338g012 [Gracilaria domingensis]|nr:hypothetical protein FGB62_338g012 [Gracilaria domingensis]